MIDLTLARRSLVTLATLLCLGSFSHCRLFYSVDSLPTDATRLECRATVQNLAAGAQTNLSSVNEPIVDEENPDPGYFFSDQCNPETSFASLQEVELEWQRYMARRIERLESADSSIFNAFPGEWCIVRGTLECVSTGEPQRFCEIQQRSPGPPVDFCLDPPVAGPCLALDCNADNCDTIDFSAVAIGDTGQRNVLVRNCGTLEAVALTLDGQINPTGAVADFEIPLADNECHPELGDGERVVLRAGESCGFSILFSPETEGLHEGELLFTSNAQADLHRITLAGEAP